MNEARLFVKVQANAKKTEICGSYADALKIRLSAPPVEGKANDALLSFLSLRLCVPKRLIRIEKGEKNSKKTVVIEGWTRKESPLDWLLKEAGDSKKP
ncbi:DUF167 domain-containing protein [Candidatus Methylacidiphilum infernorum]|uniref:UPF0235 protein Minf_1293 n=1 Tax=Methylacidiphilum infernorum (isolate V4) TaxID=481448 RepID=B3DVJ4_METI4|nr:DUF167 domain-containing protein [Candidatus Methylacidiphilum infernorum]ACD83347.1 Uncharacterized conserved protein [Methylacidiphilum infernorum V4]